jgi:hypothetical protein
MGVKRVPLRVTSIGRGGKKKEGLFPRLFARFHLIHMVVDVLEDIDPASPEFIEKKPFPFGRQKFFQQDVTRGQVGGNNDFPQLIDFGGQGFQLHRLTLLKKRSMGWEYRNPSTIHLRLISELILKIAVIPETDKIRVKVILNNKNSSRSSA